MVMWSEFDMIRGDSLPCRVNLVFAFCKRAPFGTGPLKARLGTRTLPAEPILGFNVFIGYRGRSPGVRVNLVFRAFAFSPVFSTKHRFSLFMTKRDRDRPC